MWGENGFPKIVPWYKEWAVWFIVAHIIIVWLFIFAWAITKLLKWLG